MDDEKATIGSQESIDTFLQYLKNGALNGSFDVAMNTVLLLRKLIGTIRWNNAKELLDCIRQNGKKITAAHPAETSVGNMVKRVLKIIREEYKTLLGSNTGEIQQNSFIDADDTITGDYSKPITGLKSTIIDAVNELISELDTSRDNIASQALEHIHTNEIIMTIGKSRTVEKFLKNAARKRRFSVIVSECAPFCHGQELARSLAEAGIKTTVIIDSAVFAIMARVNKVIIGTHTVMADGGLKAINGSSVLALAAKHHSVPLIVCSGLFKLAPQFVCSYDHDSINKFLSPDDVLEFSNSLSSDVLIHNPVFDYVPPELVNLFISDVGGNAPSYMYRLLNELYHPDDHTL